MLNFLTFQELNKIDLKCKLPLFEKVQLTALQGLQVQLLETEKCMK